MLKTTRSIINISLPEAMAEEVKKEIKIGGFATTSEFFRHVFREHRKMRLAQELHQEKELFSRGGGKVLKSLRDLR
ncbi:MAG: ribbon-helix-helix domain-containing protein [Candidatus Parcubacteria bacterium]|nr:ribbon-helix-helix domain-containing protein [Candidatus Parcubacteria bacterium]